jgi:hypothetical protein
MKNKNENMLWSKHTLGTKIENTMILTLKFRFCCCVRVVLLVLFLLAVAVCFALRSAFGGRAGLLLSLVVWWCCCFCLFVCHICYIDSWWGWQAVHFVLRFYADAVWLLVCLFVCLLVCIIKFVNVVRSGDLVNWKLQLCSSFGIKNA